MTNRVPLAAPTRLGDAEATDIRAALARVLDEGPWIGGPAVAEFELEFATYLGAAETHQVVGVANGTDALAIAFCALDLPPGAEVLVAADEGGYAAVAATQVGLRARVMDLDPATGVPTAETAERAYSPDVAALVVTHLHGDAVPLADLDQWRRDHGLLLVEDCAQAHGLRVDGRHVGLVGDAATFSFYPTKNLGAVGDAGAVLLPVAAAEAARRLREYGWGDRFQVQHPRGRNSRLDPLQAAVLSARLPYLDGRNARRREVANRLREVVDLHGDPRTTVAHHAVALVEDRDETARRLAERGVATGVHYPWLDTQMSGLEVRGEATPVAESRRTRILSLPCFPEISDDELDQVCAAVAAVVAR